MKKIIVAIFLVLIITQIFALQKKSFEMGRVSIIGKVKKDRSNISKDVYSVDSLFESAQIKDSLIDSSLTVRNLGSVGSLLTATLKGAKSPQTAKMFDGVLLNSPANGDFDISWIEKEMLSSIKIEYSPFFMNSSGSGSGGMIDFSGLNHTPNILGISLGSEKYKKHYINTMIDDFTTLFISNKEYRGGSSLERGRQNSIYIKKNKERFKTSLWYADRTQYLLGPSTFLTPGNYNDSTLFVYSLRSSPVKEIEYGLSAVIEKNSLYEKNLDTMSPTSTKRYNVFFNRDFNDLKVKLTYEKFIGKSEQFADTDFDGLWDTKRGYDKEEDLYSVSMRKSLSPFLILTGKYYSREDEDYQEFTILKDFDDHSKIVIGNRYNSPTFNDLYWPNSGFTKGNPLLKSETSGFVEYQKKIGKLFLDISYDRYKDLIEWMPDNLGVWRPVNLSKAKIISANISYRLSDILTFDINRKQAKNGNDNPLIYRPILKSVLRLKKDDLDILLNYIGKRFISGNWWGGHTTVDLNWSNEKFYLTIQNLFNREYISTLNYPTAKRTVFFGVRTKI